MTRIDGQVGLETAVQAGGDGHWTTHLHENWNIGTSSNGGYALTPVLRVAADVAGHPDPLSVTAHFLRPCEGGRDADITAQVVRSGRTIGTANARLQQGDVERLTMMAAFGDLSVSASAAPELMIDPPDLPPPDECVERSELAQAVELPIVSRVDVRVRPEHAVPGGSDAPVVDGWIRLADGEAPSAMTLPLFADAFPPSLYTYLDTLGWVPTVELTVHVRRRPAPGWIQARLECDDIQGGRMIESATLWDSTGAVVARSRQIGLVVGTRGR